MAARGRQPGSLDPRNSQVGYAIPRYTAARISSGGCRRRTPVLPTRSQSHPISADASIPATKAAVCASKVSGCRRGGSDAERNSAVARLCEEPDCAPDRYVRVRRRRSRWRLQDPNRESRLRGLDHEVWITGSESQRPITGPGSRGGEARGPIARSGSRGWITGLRIPVCQRGMNESRDWR